MNTQPQQHLSSFNQLHQTKEADLFPVQAIKKMINDIGVALASLWDMDFTKPKSFFYLKEQQQFENERKVASKTSSFDIYTK